MARKYTPTDGAIAFSRAELMLLLRAVRAASRGLRTEAEIAEFDQLERKVARAASEAPAEFGELGYAPNRRRGREVR